MNSLAALALIYALMTAGSASILFFSFKGRIDFSGKFFLFAESLMPFAALGIILSNLSPSFETSAVFFTTNFLALLSEISIIFSIHSLSRDVKMTQYILAIFGIALYCGLIELSRELSGAKLPVALFGLISAGIAFGAYKACKSSLNQELKTNQFLCWIGYLEICIGLFAILRILSCISDAPINPRDPTLVATLLYATFLVLNFFRYISYQSLRISWVDPRSMTANPLNKNLVKAIEEKDNLLRGLIASNRVIGISALASSITHQISQPLTTVALQTESLKLDLFKSENNKHAEKTLDKITFQLSKLSALIKNLRELFYAKSYNHDLANMQVITNEILEIIEPTFRLKKITLIRDFVSNPSIKCDSIQIQQVLINLINNAIDSIGNLNSKLREIKLTIDSDERFAIISVEDSGNGINPNDLTSIFDLYKTTKKGGLGVGLWLSKTIIDKHQGSIIAFNKDEGGAAFKIYLPLADKSKE